MRSCLPAFVLFGIIVLAILPGCSRQHYRMKADKDVYSLLESGGTNDCRWKLDDYRLDVDPRSRMYSRFHPDCEPMPPDDASAHAKMHRVDGKKGSKHWHDNGVTKHVENPCWRQYLLYNEKGEVPLSIDEAVEFALLHSPEYQAALENLYLSAAKVSQERFRFDVQFYGGESLFYTAGGRLRDGGGTFLNNDIDIEAQKLFATGGELVVGLANSITWTFNGQNSWYADSIFNIGLVQPLLRNAGRKVVLENLTQSERDFLASIRQMVYFQQGFYTKIVTGSGQQSLPPGKIGANIPLLSQGYFGLLAQQIRVQNQRQNIIGLEGNLRRFEELFDSNQIDDVFQVEETRQSLLGSESRLLAEIAEYQSNVETYLRSLGLPPDLKVEVNDPVMEQFQLLSETITVLQEDIGNLLGHIRQKSRPLPGDFHDDLEDIVHRTQSEMQILENDLIALEKSIPERIAGLRAMESHLAEQIRQGERIEPAIYDSEEFMKRLQILRERDIPTNLEKLEAAFLLLRLVAVHDEAAMRDMIEKDGFTPEAREAMRKLRMLETVDVPRSEDGIFSKQEELEKARQTLESLKAVLDEIPETASRPTATEGQTPPLVPKAPQWTLETEPAAERNEATIELRVSDPDDPDSQETQKIITELEEEDTYREWLRNLLTEFQNEVASLSIAQIKTRLDTITLVPTLISAEEAFKIAEENRLDWMNRRASLVDAWRQIDITANKLKGDLNVKVEGELGTVDKRGVRFDGDNGRLRVGLEWDSPLTRHNEMLDYRRAQIDYQAARRDYYTYVDAVNSQLRDILRDIRLYQINFEIQRNAIFIAAKQVDVAQLNLIKPAKRGDPIDTDTSRRLIRSLDDMTSTQNEFISVWVRYQTRRMLLDLNMGTMELDRRGRWIDPGRITKDRIGQVARHGGRNAVPSLTPSKRKHNGKYARQTPAFDNGAVSHAIPPAPRLDGEITEPVLAPPVFDIELPKPEKEEPQEKHPEAPAVELKLPELTQPKPVRQNTNPKTARQLASQPVTGPDTFPASVADRRTFLQPAPPPPKTPE